MDLELTGKSVLITGGSRGIGSATARAFAAEGASLHLASRSADQLERARDALLHEHHVPIEVHPAESLERR